MSGTASDLAEVEAEAEHARLRLKWNVYDPAQLKRRIASLGSGGFLDRRPYPQSKPQYRSQRSRTRQKSTVVPSCALCRAWDTVLGLPRYASARALYGL